MSAQTMRGLRCPACRAVALSAGDSGSARCAACGTPVPYEEGVAILAPGWRALAAELAEAQAVNPSWYLTEQPPETVSPWRHHLRKRREYVERQLRSFLRERGSDKVERLLDCGCGDGNNLAWLAPYAKDAYGSDYNLVRLVRAQRRNPSATIFAADILDFPADDDLFDVIFFNHVIEHIPDDVGALRSIRRVLKPGGLLVLGTPNEGAWWWQWAYRRDLETLRQTDHCHFYTARTIEAKLLKAGFAVSAIHHMGWGPPDWRLDGQWRGSKFLDDAFAAVGRVFLPRQASSLYLLATK
jgi:SAM-dependent methyltransferase